MDKGELNVFVALNIQTQYEMPKITQLKTSPAQLEIIDPSLSPFFCPA